MVQFNFTAEQTSKNYRAIHSVLPTDSFLVQILGRMVTIWLVLGSRLVGGKAHHPVLAERLLLRLVSMLHPPAFYRIFPIPANCTIEYV